MVKGAFFCLLFLLFSADGFADTQTQANEINHQQSLRNQFSVALSNKKKKDFTVFYQQFLPKELLEKQTDNFSPIFSFISENIRKHDNYLALESLHQYITSISKKFSKFQQLTLFYQYITDYMYFSKFDYLYELFVPYYSLMESWQPIEKSETELLANSWFFFSQVLLRRNQSQQALAALFRSEALFQSIDINHKDLYRLDIIIGEVYLHLQRYKDAEFYIKKGIKHFPKNRTDARGYTAALLADSYVEQNKVDLALTTLQQYLEDPVDTRKDYQLYVDDIYAKVLLAAGKTAQAFSIASEALLIAKKLDDKDLIAQAKFRLATVLIEKKQYNKAEQLIKQALSTVSSNGKINQAKMYQTLVDLLASQQKYQQALAVYKKYKAMSEARIIRENDVRIKDIELARQQQKTEQAQAKFVSLQEKQSLQINLVEQKNKNIKTVAIALFLLVLLLVVAIVALYLLFKTIKRSNQQLSLLSLEDPLTQLKNRRYVQSFIEVEAPRLIRAREKALVLLIDVDYFKSINDVHGHGVGDQVMIEIASFLKQNFRQEDVISRWGGDEFLVICRSQGEQFDQQKCKQLKEDLARMTFSSNKLTVTFSIGGCYFPYDSYLFETEDNLTEITNQWQQLWQQTLKMADEALYRVKSQGRNNTEIDIGKVKVN